MHWPQTQHIPTVLIVCMYRNPASVSGGKKKRVCVTADAGVKLKPLMAFDFEGIGAQALVASPGSSL